MSKKTKKICSVCGELVKDWFYPEWATPCPVCLSCDANHGTDVATMNAIDALIPESTEDTRATEELLIEGERTVQPTIALVRALAAMVCKLREDISGIKARTCRYCGCFTNVGGQCENCTELARLRAFTPDTVRKKWRKENSKVFAAWLDEQKKGN